MVEPPSPIVKESDNRAVFGKQLTTGVGTKRFAAPEQMVTQGKLHNKRAAYGFKADIYSLGVVLLDLFRNNNIYPQELQEIHEAML